MAFEFSWQQMQATAKQVNKLAGGTCNYFACYTEDFTFKVLEGLKSAINSGQLARGKSYSTGLTDDDAHYIAVYKMGDGTNDNIKRIKAVVNAFDSLYNKPKVVEKPKVTNPKVTEPTVEPMIEEETANGDSNFFTDNLWIFLVVGGGAALWYFSKK